MEGGRGTMDEAGESKGRRCREGKGMQRGPYGGNFCIGLK